jgi:hypothetical protein
MIEHGNRERWYETEIHFGTWEYMLPQPNKHFENSEQKICAYISIDTLCVYTKFREKLTYFVDCVKRQNKCQVNNIC